MFLRRFLNILLITLLFIFLSFVSSEFAIAFFYCFIFIITLSKPWILEIVTIFSVSIFCDIYNSQFIGISFIQFIILYMLVLRFKSVLLNSRIIFGVYCFSLLIIIPEFFLFLISLIFRNTFNIYDHIMRWVMSISLCSIYCFIAFIMRKIRDNNV